MVTPHRLRIFRVNAKDAIGGDRITQFGRVLSELNIDIICANSPQAKGRVERAFGTLQDRLVKELRLAGISTIEAANAWLPAFIADYNARFSREPENPKEDPFELNREAAVRIVHDIDRLAHQTAGERRRIQQEHHAVVMQGQVLRDGALLAPGENLAEVVRLGQLAVQVPGAGHGRLGLRRIRPRALGQQRRFQRFDVVRQCGGISVHTAVRITNAGKLVPSFVPHADSYGLSGGLRSPALLRLAPVSRLQQITHLPGRQRHRAFDGLRPNKMTTIQTFCVQRQAEAIMPQGLKQRTAAPAEDVNVARERITSQSLLHLQGQTPHAATHVGMSGCDPDPHAGRNRDHPRNAVSTRRNAARFTSLPTRTCRPLPSSISIRPDGGRTGGGDESDRAVAVGGGVSNIFTGMKTGISGATRTPYQA